MGTARKGDSETVRGRDRKRERGRERRGEGSVALFWLVPWAFLHGGFFFFFLFLYRMACRCFNWGVRG